MRRLALWGVAGVLLLAAVSIGWVWFAPSDPAGWHVDPLSAPDTGQRNAWRVGPAGETGTEAVAGWDAVAPLYAADAAELAGALDEVALAEPGTARLAGAPDELWVTYVQRSRWMRFPDYVSVRTLPAPGGATLAIFSRARFGRDDRGVNRARVERWLTALEPLEAGR